MAERSAVGGETFWTEFLRSFADRGLRGVKLAIAVDDRGLRATARRVFNISNSRQIKSWRTVCSQLDAHCLERVATFPIQDSHED